MKNIAIVNQKGGCGKTITSINLASFMNLQGYKVLLVDMDPQGHSSLGIKVDPDAMEKSLVDILVNPFEPGNTLEKIIVNIRDGWDIVPSNIQLSSFEPRMMGVMGKEESLKNSLRLISHKYDITIIDSPPNLGLLTFNTLMCAHWVIIPVETSIFSLHGIGNLLETIDIVEHHAKHKINFKAIATLFDSRTRFCREILEDIRQHFGKNIFNTVINMNIRLKEAASFGKSIDQYDRRCSGYRDYEALAQEVTAEIKGLTVEEKPYNEIDLVSTPEKSSQFNDINEIKKSLQEEIYIQKEIKQELSEEEFVKFPKIIGDKVLFTYMNEKARAVAIAGDFNDWDTRKAKMKKDPKGNWKIMLDIKPGEYQYKLLVDEEWIIDPINPEQIENQYGSKNSLLKVKSMVSD